MNAKNEVKIFIFQNHYPLNGYPLNGYPLNGYWRFNTYGVRDAIKEGKSKIF
jgi:hypothetical protein